MTLLSFLVAQENALPTNREAIDPTPRREKDHGPRQKAKEVEQKQRHDVRWIHVPINDVSLSLSMSVIGWALNYGDRFQMDCFKVFQILSLSIPI